MTYINYCIFGDVFGMLTGWYMQAVVLSIELFWRSVAPRSVLGICVDP